MWWLYTRFTSGKGQEGVLLGQIFRPSAAERDKLWITQGVTISDDQLNCSATQSTSFCVSQENCRKHKTYTQAPKYMIRFSSTYQNRFGEIYHYITCSSMDPLQWMGAVRMRVQTDDKNITIIHKQSTPLQSSNEHLVKLKKNAFVRNNHYH